MEKIEPSVVTETKTVTTSGPSAKMPVGKVILNTVIILVLIGAVGVGAYLIGRQSTTTQNPNSTQNSSQNGSTVTGNNVDSNGNPVLVGDVACNVANPAYQLSTVAGDISVPACWKVSTVNHTYQNLTNAEINQYMKLPGGAWPIYKTGVLGISKGNSVVTINRDATYVPGGFGGTTPPLASGATILVAPQGQYVDDNSPRATLGSARLLQDGKYNYYVIYSNPDYDPNEGANSEGSIQYYRFSSALNVSCNVTYTFSGDQADLVAADALFESAIRANSSKWCD